MTKKKLSQSCIFSGISEFKLSLEFALTFNPSLPKRKSEKVPEKPLFLGFLKGSGEERLVLQEHVRHSISIVPGGLLVKS